MPCVSYQNRFCLAAPSSSARWVCLTDLDYTVPYKSLFQDRENESRFGATPVPGKIGMAMAGRGLHAAPPPRPPHHDYFGQSGSNPGNQLYVGNVRASSLSTLQCGLTPP